MSDTERALAELAIQVDAILAALPGGRLRDGVPLARRVAELRERAEAAERENVELREALAFYAETLQSNYGNRARAALSRDPAAPRVPDLDTAEDLLRRIFYKLPLHNVTDQREVQRRWEVRKIVSDALRAMGRHSDQKAPVPGGVQTPEEDCAACQGDPEAHDLHVCGKEPFS